MLEKRGRKAIPIEELKEIRAPQHLALIYDSTAEWEAFIASFVRIGLARKEKCLYIYDTHSAKQLRDTLRSLDVNVSALETSGQLVLVHGSRFQVKGGIFDPDKTLDLLIQETNSALQKGFSALRISTETEWALQQFPGSERFMEYEARSNSGLCAHYPCLYICQFEREKFSTEMIKGIMQTHPVIIRGNQVYPNSYYVDPEIFFKSKHQEIQTLEWFHYAEREVRMEKEIQENARRLQLFFDNALAIILVLDEAGRYIDANPAALEFHECSKEELLQKTIWETIPEEQRRVSPLPPPSNPQTLEADCLIKGRTKTLLLNLVPVTTGGKKMVYGIGQDITHLKEMEKSLAQNEQNFRAMAENNNDTIFVLAGEHGNIVYHNRQTSELTGYDSEELLKMKLSDLAAPRERARLNDNYHRRVRGEILPNRYEVDILDKEGNAKIVEVSGARTIWENQPADLVIFRDITARRNIEQALKLSENKLRAIFETIIDGITLTDLNGKIIDLNRKALDLYRNGKKEEILGKNIFDLVSSADRESARQSFARCLVEGMLENIEYSLIRADGSEYTAELSGSVLKDNLGKSMGVIVVSRDITERKEAREAIEGLYQKEKIQRQELEEEARSRGLFIDVLAHELRTPLTPILVSAEMLEELCSNQPEDIRRKLVNHLNQGVHVLSTRLEELLDIGRYSRGTFKLHPQTVILNDFFHEVLARFKPVLDERGQKLEIELAEDMNVAELDPLRIEQVIINLLSNASKFSSNHGKVIFKAYLREGMVVVEVIDFGIGVTDEEQKRLFQPYHRIEQDRQTFPGIGLGLAVSKQIIEAHEGKIWLTSRPGQGSNFSFKIPLKQAQARK